MKQFWAQRTRSEQRMLILCVLAIIVGGYLIMTPPESKNKKLLPAAEARQKYSQVQKDLFAASADIDRLKPQINSMVYTDAPEALIPKVITTLQQYATQSGVHLREIKPLRMRRLSGMTKVPLNVRFTSEFGKSVPFLYRVEDPTGKLIIEKYTISAADPKTHMVDVDLQIAMYTQRNFTTNEPGGA